MICKDILFKKKDEVKNCSIRRREDRNFTNTCTGIHINTHTSVRTGLYKQDALVSI